MTAVLDAVVGAAGLALLLFGVLKLVAVPLAAWFELQDVRRRRSRHRRT